MNSNNSPVQSPLMEEARNCYLNRRKHRKIIKKMMSRVAREYPRVLGLRKTKSLPEGQQAEVLRVLTQRQIPPFLMDLVLKKRIFNIGSIKKMAINPTDDKFELPSLDFMTEQCRKQES